MAEHVTGLDANDRQLLAELINWFRHFNPEGGVNTPFGSASFNVEPRRRGEQIDLTYFAEITDSVLVSGQDARWQYAHREVLLTTLESNAITDGRTGTLIDGFAINVLERGHVLEPSAGTPWYVWGVDVHGIDYPAGFRPRPVGGGGTTDNNKYSPIVLVTEGVDDQGDLLRTFQVMGSHDGTCA